MYFHILNGGINFTLSPSTNDPLYVDLTIGAFMSNSKFPSVLLSELKTLFFLIPDDWEKVGFETHSRREEYRFKLSFHPYDNDKESDKDNGNFVFSICHQNRDGITSRLAFMPDEYFQDDCDFLGKLKKYVVGYDPTKPIESEKIE